MKPSTWKATFLLIATFALGALAGGGVVAFADRGKPGRGWHGHYDPDDHMASLAKQLRLTPAQQDSVKAVLERSRLGMDSIWRQLGPRFGTLRDSISSEIRKVLTPEQREKYDKMIRRFESEGRREKE